MRLTGCLVLLIALPVVSGHLDFIGPSADQLWARALAAKGGADRLHAIRNFVVTESTRFNRLTEYAGGNADIIVCEPPGKWWEFLDYRPGKMGFSTELLNVEKGLHFYSFGEKSRKSLPGGEDTLARMTRFQSVYFIETAAMRPKLVSAEVITGFDVVHTDIGGQQVSFYLDRQTHLPAHVEEIRPTTTGRLSTSPSPLRRWYTLERYVEVSGIQIPTRVGLGGDFADARVEVNIDLDPALFDTPPDGVTSGDAWRRFQRSSREVPPGKW